MKSMVEVGSKYQPKIKCEGTKRAVRVAKILRPWRNSHGRLRIPHFRRIKNPQFSILEKGSRIVSNAENGGMAIDTRFVFTRPEH